MEIGKNNLIGSHMHLGPVAKGRKDPIIGCLQLNTLALRMNFWHLGQNLDFGKIEIESVCASKRSHGEL